MVARRFKANGLVESTQAYKDVVQLPEGGRIEREFEDSHNESCRSISHIQAIMING